MIRSVTARSGTSHLICALIACAIVVGILCGARLLAIQLERKTVHWVAPRDFFIKNQGLAFERAAARRPDILLLYGSSELTDPIPNRASDFFSNAPTGFQVCPVGKGGTTSLIILQKLGALGSELRGRKVAISLSASSFFTPAVRPEFYAGNFSLPVQLWLGFCAEPDCWQSSLSEKRFIGWLQEISSSRIRDLPSSGRPRADRTSCSFMAAPS